MLLFSNQPLSIDQKHGSSIQLVGVVFGPLLCTMLVPGKVSALPSMIQLHLLQALRQRMTPETMVLQARHPPKQLGVCFQIRRCFSQRHWDLKRSNTCSDWNHRLKKAPFTTPCCCVPMLNAVAVAQTLRRLEANFFCTFTRNIRQTTTKPVHLSLTCNI